LEDGVELEAETGEFLFSTLEPLVPVMIKMLPESLGLPLYMSDIEGVPQKEIADKLGLSISGAKSRIQRAREKLKELFFECCYFELDQKGMPMGFAVKEYCTPLLPYQLEGEVSLSTKSCCEDDG
jgi:RNA polymerase sigma-70 factor (ECF subfamily)